MVVSESLLKFHKDYKELDIEEQLLPDEARALIIDSYKHFALKRMLKALP